MTRPTDPGPTDPNLWGKRQRATPIPRARRSDPETSALAAEKSRESASKQATEVLEWINLRPGRTSRELAALADVDRYRFSRRAADLRRLGLVENGPPRRCRISGMLSKTWYAKGAAQAARRVYPKGGAA